MTFDAGKFNFTQKGGQPGAKKADTGDASSTHGMPAESVHIGFRNVADTGTDINSTGEAEVQAPGREVVSLTSSSPTTIPAQVDGLLIAGVEKGAATGQTQNFDDFTARNRLGTTSIHDVNNNVLESANPLVPKRMPRVPTTSRDAVFSTFGGETSITTTSGRTHSI